MYRVMKYCIPFFIILSCLADIGLGADPPSGKDPSRNLEKKHDYSNKIEFHPSPFNMDIPKENSNENAIDRYVRMVEDEDAKIEKDVRNRNRPAPWPPMIIPQTERTQKKENWILPPKDDEDKNKPNISLFSNEDRDEKDSGWGWLAEEMKKRTEQAEAEQVKQQDEQDQETEEERTDREIEELDEKEIMERAQKEQRKPLNPILPTLTDYQPANETASAAAAPVSGFDRMAQSADQDRELNASGKMAESFDFGSNPLNQSPNLSMISEEDPWAAKQDEWNNESPYATPFSSGPVQEQQIITAQEPAWGMASEIQVHKTLQRPAALSESSFGRLESPSYQSTWDSQPIGGTTSYGGDTGFRGNPVQTEPETAPTKDRWADRDIFREPLFNPEAHSLFK